MGEEVFVSSFATWENTGHDFLALA